jgi:asparaginyl-tRNA synthetase
VADISHWEGRRVELRGWLYNSRSSGKLRFLQVRDGSGIIQCVVFQGDVSSKVYCFGPTFRAEKSKTRRHLTEFWMIEPEMAYCDLAGDMEVAEGMVAHVVRRVLADCRSDLAALERDLAPLEKILGDEPFPRLSYDEAIESLHGLGSDVEWGSDLGGEDETLLSQQYDRPILVHRYPAAVKAFYMKQDPEDERLALCVDMLAPEG